MSATFSEIMDSIRGLDGESKQTLLDTVHAWIIEERRDAIVHNAIETEKELEQGRAKSGNLDDLKADLYADD